MTRFFLAIWAGIKAFFALFFPSRQKRTSKANPKKGIPKPRRGGDDIEFVFDEPQMYETWLGRVVRLTLLVRNGKFMLVIKLPGLLADRFFQKLLVVIFPLNQRVGIEFSVMDGIRVSGGHEHILRLEPTSEWNAISARVKTFSDGYCVSGIERITLSVADETADEMRDFQLNGKNGFFVPTERRVV